MKKRKFLGIAAMFVMASLLGGCSDAGVKGASKESAGIESEKASESMEAGSESMEAEAGSKAGEEAGATAQTTSLKERGEEVLELLLEKVQNEDYNKMLSMTSSLQNSDYYQKLKNASYDKLKHVYEVEFADELYNLYITTYAKAGVIWDNMSAELQDNLRDQILDSYVTLINSHFTKLEAVALGSMFSTADFYVDANFSHKREMMIYVFEDGYPIVVTFSGKTDGAVSAKANILFADEFDYETVEEVKDALVKTIFNGVEEFLGAINVSVEDVTE